MREDFEGLRPLAAALAVLILAIAAEMVSATIRSAHPSLTRPPRAQTARRTLWIVAVGAALVTVYVFFAAAPGGPDSPDSWGEVILAAVGLWIGLVASRLVGQPLMWAFVGVAGLALVTASVVVAAL